MKGKRKRGRRAPDSTSHDSVGGETVGGAEEIAARTLAVQHSSEAMQSVIRIMRNGGRGAMARLAAAKEVLRVAGFDEDGNGDDGLGDGELSPADLELMKRFLQERAAKQQ
jgi:hypothetical protein